MPHFSDSTVLVPWLPLPDDFEELSHYCFKKHLELGYNWLQMLGIKYESQSTKLENLKERERTYNFM